MDAIITGFKDALLRVAYFKKSGCLNSLKHSRFQQKYSAHCKTLSLGCEWSIGHYTCRTIMHTYLDINSFYIYRQRRLSNKKEKNNVNVT